MSVPREGLRVGSGSLPLTSDPLFTHDCHCLNCQQQTGTALVINLLIETDRVQLLAGDQQPVEAPPDDGSTQRIFRCPPVRWLSTPSTDTQDCGSSVAARPTSPHERGAGPGGRALVLPATSAPTSGRWHV